MRIHNKFNSHVIATGSYVFVSTKESLNFIQNGGLRDSITRAGSMYAGRELEKHMVLTNRVPTDCILTVYIWEKLDVPEKNTKGATYCFFLFSILLFLLRKADGTRNLEEL